MAKREEKLNYGEICRELKRDGPGRLYLLHGAEDYLRESFLEEIKALCFPDGGEDFGYHRLEGAAPDLRELADAVNALPFLSERTLCVLRGPDLNKYREAEAERLSRILSDIPEFCTLCIVLPSGYEPDWRLKTAKTVKKLGRVINFTAQSQGQLVPWIRRRFSALGKQAEPDACMRLIYTSGELMGGLIPEIEKIAAGTAGERVTAADVDRLAHRLPEAHVFDMCDCLSARGYDGAARLLGELTATAEEPIRTLAMIGTQMRRLYAARLALDEGLGVGFVNEVCGIRYDFISEKLMRSARGFTLPALARAVALCAETDADMKSSSVDDTELLTELLLRLAMGATA